VVTIELIQSIIEGLNSIEIDNSVPRNVRIRIKTAIEILSNEQEKNFSIKVYKSLEQLSYVADDPNIPQYTRMQIWNVVSQLESDKVELN